MFFRISQLLEDLVHLRACIQDLSTVVTSKVLGTWIHDLMGRTTIGTVKLLDRSELVLGGYCTIHKVMCGIRRAKRLGL